MSLFLQSRALEAVASVRREFKRRTRFVRRPHVICGALCDPGKQRAKKGGDEEIS